MLVVSARFTEASPGGHVNGSSGVSRESCPDDYFVLNPPDSFDRSRVDCATIDVPAVYGRDSGLPDFRLAMMRVRATGDAKKLGTLFVNPGGPGGSDQGQSSTSPSLGPSMTPTTSSVSIREECCTPSLFRVSRSNIRTSSTSPRTGPSKPAPRTRPRIQEIERFGREFQSDCERRTPRGGPWGRVMWFATSS